LDAAQQLADTLGRIEADSQSERCCEVYRRLFSRSPSEGELALCSGFLDQQSKLLRREGRREADREAWVDLCRALLNSNEFLYVD
jgi:hypothetical protein